MCGPSSRKSSCFKQPGVRDIYMTVYVSPANVPADCINLGQGFMNWAPPDWIRSESHECMDHDIMANHYSHPRGRPRLLKAISKHYSPQFENIVARGKDLANEEILVTAGANCGEWYFNSITDAHGGRTDMGF